jgi:hypothetical protein
MLWRDMVAEYEAVCASKVQDFSHGCRENQPDDVRISDYFFSAAAGALSAVESRAISPSRACTSSASADLAAT